MPRPRKRGARARRSVGPGFCRFRARRRRHAEDHGADEADRRTRVRQAGAAWRDGTPQTALRRDRPGRRGRAHARHRAPRARRARRCVRLPAAVGGARRAGCRPDALRAQRPRDDVRSGRGVGARGGGGAGVRRRGAALAAARRGPHADRRRLADGAGDRPRPTPRAVVRVRSAASRGHRHGEEGDQRTDDHARQRSVPEPQHEEWGEGDHRHRLRGDDDRREGFRATDPQLLLLLRSVGARPWGVFWRVRVPAALPFLAAGLRTGVTLSLVGAVVAEWTGTDRGLGYLVLSANARLATAQAFAAVLVITLLGLAAYGAAVAVERRLYWWDHDPADS